ncbi:MAG: fluoride efflux transporter CrcB [Gammaproteobacteria bacterium]
MKLWLSVGIGGFVGAILRFAVSRGAVALLGARFPWGTLIVNAGGAFLVGFLAALFLTRIDVGPSLRALLLTGILGGLTTFSTFTIETLNLVQGGAAAAGLANIALNVGTGLLLVWLGYNLGTLL